MSLLFQIFLRTKYCVVILGQCPFWRCARNNGSDMLCCRGQHCRSRTWMYSYTSYVSPGVKEVIYETSYECSAAWGWGGVVSGKMSQWREKEKLSYV